MTEIYLFRRRTAAQWVSGFSHYVPNPVLLPGELGLETDTRRFKFGDGISAWVDLPYGVNQKTLYMERFPTLTIVSGAVTLPAEGSHFAIDTEGLAATDTLHTINGALDGRIIILRQASSGRDITIDSTGNINISTATRELKFNGDGISLVYDAGIAQFTMFASTVPGQGTIENKHLAGMAPNLIKGRVTAGTGDPEDLTGAQVAALLPVVTSSAKGLAPQATGNAPDVLHGDATWAPVAAADVTGLGALALASTVSLTTQATGTLQAGQMPALTGDVTNAGLVMAIGANKVTNAQLATVAANTVKANATAGVANPTDVTIGASQLFGRGATGNLAPITLGLNLSMTGTTLNAAGGGGGGLADGTYGDIVVSGGATVMTVGARAIDFPKMQAIATARLLGRNGAGSGDIQELTATTVKGMLAISTADITGLGTLAGLSSVNLTTQANGTLQAGQMPALTGDVTTVAGALATTIAAGSVTLAKMANMATASLIYRKTAGSGAPEVNTLATLKTDLGLTGTNSGDQTITLTGAVTGSGAGSFATSLAADIVTNANLANMATATFKGRSAAGTGNPEDMTPAEAAALLPVATTAAKGLMPQLSNVPGQYVDGTGAWVSPSPITRFTYGVKTAYTTDALCITASADFTDMLGYAAFGSVTGGGTGTVFWVRSSKDDISEVGTLRWAVNEVLLSGAPGRVLFDPRQAFDVVLNEQLELPANITIDAPGRNARIWSNTEVTRLKAVANNVIIRRMAFGTLTTGNTTERDGVWIEPTLCQKFWVDSCTFALCGDGCLDIVSITDPVTEVYGSVSNCLFRNHDKVSLVGSLACYQDTSTSGPVPAYCSVGGSPPTTKIFVTFYRNAYENTAQRNPKVLPLAFVHMANNVHHHAPFLRDDGTTSTVYGVYAGTGAIALVERDLFTSAETTGWAGIDTASGVFSPRVGLTLAVDGPGFTKQIGCVAADGVTIATSGSASVPTPPYSLSLLTITDTPAGRAAFRDNIRATVGAEIDAAPEGEFIFDAASTANANGADVISIAATGAGRWKKVSRKIKREEPVPFPDPTIYAPRQTTLTIASDAITLPAQGSYFAVDTEASAATDTLATINGATDGRIIILRPASSSRDITVVNTGNIQIPASRLLALNSHTLAVVYDGGIAKFIEVSNNVSAGGAPGGASGEVQFNSSGSFDGAAEVEIEGGQLRLDVPASAPATPAAGGVKLTARTTVGRTKPAFLTPDGDFRCLQPELARSRALWWRAQSSSATLLSLGGLPLPATHGTATVAGVFLTNMFTRTPKLEYLVTAAATTAIAGFRSVNGFCSLGGAAAGEGGFDFVGVWGPATGVATTTLRAAFGLRSSGSALTDANPSAQVNCVFMGWDAADTNVQMMFNDATGTCTKVDLGASFPKPTVDRTTLYELAMYSPKGTTQSVNWTVTDLVTGDTASGTQTTGLPATSATLMPFGYCSVGGTSSVVGFGLSSLYIDPLL